MGVLFGTAVLFIFWSVCYLLNTFLLECSYTSALYAKILSKNGLTVNVLQIKWYTVRCNRLFIRLSNWRANFWKWWFNLGVLLGVVGQFASIGLLVYTLVDFFRVKPQSEQILVPVIPGVNLPTDQTAYYLITLFLCGIFHEFGHAIAASREQVRVNGFGVFLMFIFPGAYVDLCSDHLMILSPFRQLRIFCAGVWHNLILVLIALACLQVHPLMVRALFTRQVYVSNVLKDSPLKSIIEVDSVISSVSNCQVTSAYTWYECLYKMDLTPNYGGYCMSLDEIFYLASNTNLKKNFTSINDCCLENVASSYCFEWKSSPKVPQHYACLPARYTTDKPECMADNDCMHTEAASSNDRASSNKVCVKPAWDNSTKLLRIVHNKGPPVLYVGSIKELLYSIYIGEYIPRFSFIPRFLNQQTKLLLKYVVAFSGAIGILNLVPCYALDGQYILASILSMHKNPHRLLETNEVKRPYLYSFFIILGTSLLVINLILGVFSLFVSKSGFFL